MIPPTPSLAHNGSETVLYVLILIISGQMQPVTLKFESLGECRVHAHRIVNDPRPFDPAMVNFFSPNGTSQAYCRGAR